eukprot:COSAG06_NODE_854_length_11931_cov_55.985970_4_plen_63_part_00
MGQCYLRTAVRIIQNTAGFIYNARSYMYPGMVKAEGTGTARTLLCHSNPGNLIGLVFERAAA